MSTSFWRAMYDYEGVDTSQLSFQAGDVFFVSEVHDGGWFTAERGADIGYVPSNYLEPMQEEPEQEEEEDDDDEAAAAAYAQLLQEVAEDEEREEAARQAEGVQEACVQVLQERPPAVTLLAQQECGRLQGRQRLSLAGTVGTPAPNIVSVQKLRSPVVVRQRLSRMDAEGEGEQQQEQQQQEAQEEAQEGERGEGDGRPKLPECRPLAYRLPPADQFPTPPLRLDLGEAEVQEEEEAEEEEPQAQAHEPQGAFVTPMDQQELLARGAVFHKYSRKRKTQSRFVAVTNGPELRIQWREVEKKKFSSDNTMLLSDVHAVTAGHSTQVFLRHIRNGTARSPCLAFSVVCKGGPEAPTLDLEAPTEQIRNQWVEALSSLHRQFLEAGGH